MTYIKKLLLDTGVLMARRQMLAKIAIMLGFVQLLTLQMTANISSGLISLNITVGIVLVMFVTQLLVLRYLWSYLYSVIASLLLSYVCISLYLSDVDIRIQIMFIPLLPLILYFLNPLWLFNITSLLFLFLLQVVKESYLPTDATHYQALELVVFAYFLVWLVLLVEAMVNRHDNSRLQSYLNYDEDNGVISSKALLSVLEKCVANALRYKQKMSVVMLEFYHLVENHKPEIVPGYKYESHFLASVSANLRRGDTLAKWKENSFVIIVPESDTEGSEKLLQKLEQIICRIRLPGLGVPVMRYGVAVLSHQSHIELLEMAGQALEANKRQEA